MEQEIQMKTPDMIVGWLETLMVLNNIDKDYANSMIFYINKLKELTIENDKLKFDKEEVEDSIREEIYNDLEDYYRELKTTDGLTKSIKPICLHVIEQCQRLVNLPREMRKVLKEKGV